MYHVSSSFLFLFLFSFFFFSSFRKLRKDIRLSHRLTLAAGVGIPSTWHSDPSAPSKSPHRTGSRKRPGWILAWIYHQLTLDRLNGLRLDSAGGSSNLTLLYLTSAYLTYPKAVRTLFSIRFPFTLRYLSLRKPTHKKKNAPFLPLVSRISVIPPSYYLHTQSSSLLIIAFSDRFLHGRSRYASAR